jgi:hypothetical protein
MLRCPEPLYVLALDFAGAFDKMSHTYLFEILRSYGFSDRFLERVRTMYTKAVSVVQINDHMSGPLPIGCSLRHGAVCAVYQSVDTMLGGKSAGSEV